LFIASFSLTAQPDSNTRRNRRRAGSPTPRRRRPGIVQFRCHKKCQQIWTAQKL